MHKHEVANVHCVSPECSCGGGLRGDVCDPGRVGAGRGTLERRHAAACFEDWIGAGAVLSLLPGRRSPEAELAVAAFDRFRGNLEKALLSCGSGKELLERGFHRDVELASEYASSSAVPMLAGDRFVNRSWHSRLPL